MHGVQTSGAAGLPCRIFFDPASINQSRICTNRCVFSGLAGSYTGSCIWAELPTFVPRTFCALLQALLRAKLRVRDETQSSANRQS